MRGSRRLDPPGQVPGRRQRGRQPHCGNKQKPWSSRCLLPPWKSCGPGYPAQCLEAAGILHDTQPAGRRCMQLHAADLQTHASAHKLEPEPEPEPAARHRLVRARSACHHGISPVGPDAGPVIVDHDLQPLFACHCGRCRAHPHLVPRPIAGVVARLPNTCCRS